MGTDPVVVPPPVLHNHPGFKALPEPFHAQAFVPKLAVEAFCRTVLSWLFRARQYAYCSLFSNPCEQRDAYEFRPTGTGQVAGWARALMSRDSTSITRSERIDPVTSSAVVEYETRLAL